MAVGTIETSVLTDIANAIRFQAGVATLFTPGEMAAAVTALDGTNEGNYQAQIYMTLESGILSGHVFEDIADAIRGQNGSTDTYLPGEMAAVILALSWDAGLKPRAVLTSLGTLEFNYVDGRHCYSGGVPVDAWEVDSAGYSSASARPYDSVKLQVQKVVFHSSWAQVGMTNANYLLNAFESMTEVSGFENMSGMRSANQMFGSCSMLETIYATSFSNSGLSGSLMFNGCSRLVGGTDGFVPSTTSGASACKIGAGGVLTDPNKDARIWFYGHFYEDARLCSRPRRRRTPRARLGNLSGVTSMRFTFSSCSALTSLDFRGFDPLALTDLYYTFGGASALAAIYADSTRELPSSGVSGSSCFYNRRGLVGGNGTAWSSSATSYTYFRIDTASTPGCLTAQ